MEKRIFKYTLKTTDTQVVVLPEGAEILTVQTQFNEPQLWALVDPEASSRYERHIEIFGTGHSIRCDMGAVRKYIGTYQLDAGNYVFHVFERTN